jgi:drug/metabolite transporter (DMT)-like permease
MPTSGPKSWLPAFCATALIWGTSFMFIKIAVREVPPVYIALGRIGIGALTLLVLLAIVRQPLPRGLGLWARMSVLAVFGSTVPFIMFGYAEERVSSVLAGIWNGTIPLTTLAVTLIALRVTHSTERPTRQQIFGLLVGFLGVLVVLGAWHGLGGASLVGQLELFIAVSCYGVAMNYSRRIMTSSDVSPFQLTAGQMITGTLQMLIVAPLVAGAPPAPGGLTWKPIVSIVLLGVLGTGLAFVLNFHVIRTAGVTTGSMVTYLPPVVAAVAGVAVLGEHLSWNQPVGGLIVLAGVGVAQGLATRLPTRLTTRSGARRSKGRAIRRSTGPPDHPPSHPPDHPPGHRPDHPTGHPTGRNRARATVLGGLTESAIVDMHGTRAKINVELTGSIRPVRPRQPDNDPQAAGGWSPDRLSLGRIGALD